MTMEEINNMKASIKLKVKNNNTSYVKQNQNMTKIENCDTRYFIFSIIASFPIILASYVDTLIALALASIFSLAIGLIVLIITIVRKNFKTSFNIEVFIGLYSGIILFGLEWLLQSRISSPESLPLAILVVNVIVVSIFAMYQYFYTVGEYSLITMRRAINLGFDINDLNGDALLTDEEIKFLLDEYNVKIFKVVKIPLFS